MQLKKKIYDYCLQIVGDKIVSLKNAHNDLNEGIKSDTKSSAGDKHETARAMMQIEQEKINTQLKEALEQKTLLEKIKMSGALPHIAIGSLVKTNKGYLFLSVALGKITIDGVSVIVLSPQSPLGIQLLGLEKGTSVEINTTKYILENIF